MRQHFLDMGVLPGVPVTLVKYAPMGDPMELRVHGYELTLRRADARKIEVKEDPSAEGPQDPDPNGPSPLPLHKGGEYNVLLMGHKSVVTTPSPCGRVGEGSGVRRVIHKDTHQAHIMMGARAFGGNHPKHLALFLANNILGGPGLSSRLNLALREKRGLVYTVESTLTTYTDTGVWAIYFGCDHHDAEKCKRIVKKELQLLCDAPLSDKALAAAKRQIIGQIALSYDNFESVAIGMGKRMLHYGRTQTKEKMIERIQSLTAEQVWDAAKEVFNPENLTILEYR